MRLVDIATQRRVTIAMFTLAIVLFGFVSLSRLKVNLLPDLSYPTLTVRTELDGSAPLEVESLLTRPIEESVGTIKNIRQVRSVSRPGQSDVVLEFLWGTDMDIAGVEVREKLDLLELPLEASRPLLLRFDPSNEPIQRLAYIYEEAGAVANQTARLQALRRFAEDRLKNDIESVEGVAAVKVSGGLEDEIQVLVDQEKLAQLGISIQGVAARLRAENINLSGGRLEQGAQRFLVRTHQRVRQRRGNRRRHHRDPGRAPALPARRRHGATRLQGTRGHHPGRRQRKRRAGGIQGRRRQHRARSHDASTSASKPSRSAAGRHATAHGLRPVALHFRRHQRSAQRGPDRRSAGSAGAVCLPARRPRDSHHRRRDPGLGDRHLRADVQRDVSLNIMSLGGIALAIGMLVDNSIVVLENIVRKREEGASILHAAQEGTGEVAGAVTAATLTTVAVFFPMVFVSGIAGQLFRDQALTVTFALLFSLLVALTLIPMLAARGGPARYADDAEAVRPGRVTRGLAFILRLFIRLGRGIAWVARRAMRPLTWVFQGFYNLAARIYAPLLASSLRHRWIVMGAATVAFASTLAIVPRLGYELLPQLAQGEFYVDVRLPAGSPIQATDAVIQRLQERAAELPGMELSYSVAGTGNRLDASPVDAGEHTGRINFKLDAAAGSANEAQTVALLRSSLEATPGVAYEFARPALFTLNTPLEIETGRL